MRFNWNNEKNEKLKKTRGISFEDIVIAAEIGNVLDVIENKSKEYKDQIVLVVRFNNYIYAVPAIVRGNEFFLKTIFPSRKLTAKYLN